MLLFQCIKWVLDFDPRFVFVTKYILNEFIYKIVYKFEHIYPKPRTKPYQNEKPKLN